MKKTEHAEMAQAIVESMALLLGHNPLHQVLKALSKGCMARCREMLNADTPKDVNGNTLRAFDRPKYEKSISRKISDESYDD